MSDVIAKPSVAHERAFVAMVSDFEARDAENAGVYAKAKLDFAEYVRGLLDEEWRFADGRPSELQEQIGVVVRTGHEVGVEPTVHTFIYQSLLPCELRARGKASIFETSD